MAIATNVVSIETIRRQKDDYWLEARKVAEDYVRFLYSSGWGIYRIGEAHGLKPYYPAGQGRMSNGEMSQGIWSHEHVTNQMADYLLEGGEFVV